MKKERRITAHAVFYFGIFLALLGAMFLLATRFGFARFPLFSSCLFLIIGVFCAVLALKIGARPHYLFCAIFFLLAGLHLFLSGLGIIQVPFRRSWPFVSVYAGLALLAAGFRHFRAARFSFLIPALAFVFIGLALLPFSFRLVSFSFRRFMIDWWPLLMVLAGLVLMLLSLGGRPRRR